MPVSIDMQFNPLLVLRIVQAVLSVIIIGLTGHVVNWATTNGFMAPDSINFLLFCCVWTWLALAYLMAARVWLPKFYHPFGVLGVEFVTMVFWFAGWVAVAARVSTFSICMDSVCGAAKASAAFGAFSWLAWVATLTLAVMEWNQSRKTEVEGATGNKTSEPSIAEEGNAQELQGTVGNTLQYNLSPENGPVRIPSPLEYGGREEV